MAVPRYHIFSGLFSTTDVLWRESVERLGAAHEKMKQLAAQKTRIHRHIDCERYEDARKAQTRLARLFRCFDVRRNATVPGRGPRPGRSCATGNLNQKYPQDRMVRTMR
jgi:hypothetical protein